MAVTEMGSASGGPRPLRRDAELNRRRIIEAAREVFAARGLAATLDDVAHRAGVGIGTVYRRFPTKEALVEVALEDRLEELAGLAETALLAPTAWEGLTTFFCRITDMHAADRGLRDVALGTHQLARVGKRMRPPVQRLVERAQAEGTLRADFNVHDVPLLMLMVSEVAYNSEPFHPDAYVRYRQLLLDGLRAGPATGDLGEPLTLPDVNAIVDSWLPNC
ncbi:helix-turn-helix domain-containing protein [Actinoplanes sp. NPDC026623]|jgi:AcrR family transcriptional regulator|uniref:TetR/AcrR family transcriptional regulator n=1 Tax=Actinoplanes sp. NPDC026623 TaxID=3155610 RepID=UPI0033C3BD16